MMTSFESRIGKVASSDGKVHQYLSNFNHFKNIIPKDKVKDFESTESYCSFMMDGIGKAVMYIIEKEPCKLINIKGDINGKIKLHLWIQIKQVADNDTRIKLMLKADLNPMVKWMALKPLQIFLNTLIDKMESFDFNAR